MLITKEQAINYFNEKRKNEEVKTIREFQINGTENNFFLINGNYLVRFIVPEAMNSLMRNRNFSHKVSGMKLSRKDAESYVNSSKVREII